MENQKILCPWIIGQHATIPNGCTSERREILLDNRSAGHLIRDGDTDFWTPNADHYAAAHHSDIQPLPYAKTPAMSLYSWEQRAQKRRARWTLDAGIEKEFSDGRQQAAVYYDGEQVGSFQMNAEGSLVWPAECHLVAAKTIGIRPLTDANSFAESIDDWAHKWTC